MQNFNNEYYRYKANLHFHSASSDGRYAVDKLCEIIDKSPFDMVSLTDHNEVRNSLKLYEKIKDKIVLLGIEVETSDLIEILIYFKEPEQIENFYKSFVENNKILGICIKENVFNLINSLHNNEDIILGVPHPFGRKGLVRKLIVKGIPNSEILKLVNSFDFYEVLNSTKPLKNNMIAEKWYNDNDLNLYKTASSDFHNIDVSFSLAGVNIFSKNKLNKDIFFKLVKQKNSNLIKFEPYGKSLSYLQMIQQSINSAIDYLKNQSEMSANNPHEVSIRKILFAVYIFVGYFLQSFTYRWLWIKKEVSILDSLLFAILLLLLYSWFWTKKYIKTTTARGILIVALYNGLMLLYSVLNIGIQLSLILLTFLFSTLLVWWDRLLKDMSSGYRFDAEEFDKFEYTSKLEWLKNEYEYLSLQQKIAIGVFTGSVVGILWRLFGNEQTDIYKGTYIFIFAAYVSLGMLLGILNLLRHLQKQVSKKILFLKK